MSTTTLSSSEKEHTGLPFVLGEPNPVAVGKTTAALDDDKWWMLISGENDAASIVSCGGNTLRPLWHHKYTSTADCSMLTRLSVETMCALIGQERSDLEAPCLTNQSLKTSAPLSWWFADPEDVNVKVLSYFNHKMQVYDASHRKNLLRAVFHSRGGYLTRQEGEKCGFPSVYFTRLMKEGKIERVERGVYRDVEAPVTGSAAAEQLLELQLRVPWARPALGTALELHGLTTRVNSLFQVAIPKNRRLPDLERAQAEAVYFSTASYDYGLEEIGVNGRKLVTYSAAKTVADLLKYSAKQGRNLYLEGLKNYLRQGGSRSALFDAAKVNKVLDELRRDLEVLFHDV